MRCFSRCLPRGTLVTSLRCSLPFLLKLFLACTVLRNLIGMSGNCGLFCYSRSFPRHFCIWYIWCHILENLLYNNCLCIVIVLIFLAVQCHSHMEHFFLLYSSTLNLSIFLVFTPRVTVGILLSLMTVFSPRGFGFSSTAIFFFSSFYYTHCHLVTVFMSCLLFSMTVNNLFFILGLHRCVFHQLSQC